MKKFRKLLALVMAVCMVCMVSATAWAGEGVTSSEEDEEDNFVTAEELAAGKAMTEYYYQMGLRTYYGPYEDYLNVDLLLQDDLDWEGTYLPCYHSGHTYGAVGCAMTSYAMVLNYYGNNLTPVQVGNNYGTGACNFNNSTLLSNNKYGGRKGTASSYTASDTDFNRAQLTIKGAISVGKPVVVRLHNGVDKHFVVAMSYQIESDDSLYIGIQDPESDYAYNTLQEYRDEGWSLLQMVIVA